MVVNPKPSSTTDETRIRGDDNQHCLEFSLAASAMKNNVVGDFNLVTEEEINRLMVGDNEDFKVYAELQ